MPRGGAGGPAGEAHRGILVARIERGRRDALRDRIRDGDRGAAGADGPNGAMIVTQDVAMSSLHVSERVLLVLHKHLAAEPAVVLAAKSL
jgi:hypothetical protein